jgi:hypothetical protein
MNLLGLRSRERTARLRLHCQRRGAATARQARRKKGRTTKARRIQELFAKARDQATDLVGRLQACRQSGTRSCHARARRLAANLLDERASKARRRFSTPKLRCQARPGRGARQLRTSSGPAQWVPGAEVNLNYARKRRDGARGKR